MFSDLKKMETQQKISGSRVFANYYTKCFSIYYCWCENDNVGSLIKKKWKDSEELTNSEI